MNTQSRNMQNSRPSNCYGTIYIKKSLPMKTNRQPINPEPTIKEPTTSESILKNRNGSESNFWKKN